MRLISPLILALPLLASAQSYPQLQSVLSKLKSYIPSAPIASTPEAVAEAGRKNALPLTLDKWQETFATASSQAPGREWYVLITGGNETCFGSCDAVEEAWNKSTVVLSADPSPPRLAVINCETQPVLCHTWFAVAPSVWHIIPSKDETTVRIIELNQTTTTADTFLNLHKEKAWKKVEPLTGIFHPFDGLIRKLHFSHPIGYFGWSISLIPSWAMILAITFASKAFV